MSRNDEPPTGEQPPDWAVAQAVNELYDVPDPDAITRRAWELVREAQDREAERHDEYDDPDRGGEG